MFKLSLSDFPDFSPEPPVLCKKITRPPLQKSVFLKGPLKTKSGLKKFSGLKILAILHKFSLLTVFPF